MKRSDIIDGVDYESFCLLVSHLMHEKKRLGEVEVIKKYSDIESFVSNDYEHNFLYGFIKYFANKNNITIETAKPKTLNGFVIDSLDYEVYKLGVLSDSDIEELDKDSIPEFLEVGILLRSGDMED